jgi:hypothetical protein
MAVMIEVFPLPRSGRTSAECWRYMSANERGRCDGVWDDQGRMAKKDEKIEREGT